MDAAQAQWDSERRGSPYSTVSDPEDETCEVCGTEFVFDRDTCETRCGCGRDIDDAS